MKVKRTQRIVSPSRLRWDAANDLRGKSSQLSSLRSSSDKPIETSASNFETSELMDPEPDYVKTSASSDPLIQLDISSKKSITKSLAARPNVATSSDPPPNKIPLQEPDSCTSQCCISGFKTVRWSKMKRRTRDCDWQMFKLMLNNSQEGNWEIPQPDELKSKDKTSQPFVETYRGKLPIRRGKKARFLVDSGAAIDLPNKDSMLPITGFVFPAVTTDIVAVEPQMFNLSDHKSDNESLMRPGCNNWIPASISGKLVVQKLGHMTAQGFGQWKTTNDHLDPNTSGIAQRLSMNIRRIHPKLPNGKSALIPWDSTFWATLLHDRNDDTHWLLIPGLEDPPPGSEFKPSIQLRSLKSTCGEIQDISILKHFGEVGTIAPWYEEACQEMNMFRDHGVPIKPVEHPDTNLPMPIQAPYHMHSTGQITPHTAPQQMQGQWIKRGKTA